MSPFSTPFGQSSNSPFIFGQANNANTSAFGTSITTPPTSVLSRPQVTNVGTPHAATITNEAGKLQPIWATPMYSGNSLEEIRWESFNSRENTSDPPLNTFGDPSTFGQSTNSTSNQIAFGSGLGGSKFGPSSNSSFGANYVSNSYSLCVEPTSGPPFGASARSLDIFGNPGFGHSTNSNDGFGTKLGSTSFFGSTASASASASASSIPSFASSSPPFGGFGQSSSFGQARPSVSFGSTYSFGGSEPSLGTSSLGNTSLSFGAFGQPYARPSISSGTTTGVFGGSEPSFGRPFFANTSSSFGGNESKTNTFGNTSFGGFCSQGKGSRVAAYCVTICEDNGKMQSISAMPVYRGKSHEELRLEDYKASDKGLVLKYPWSFREQSSSGLYTSQNPSIQTTYNIFSPQTTSNSTFSQTTSIFSPGPFSNHTSPSVFPPQTSNNPFPRQIHSMHSTTNLFPGFFPPRTTSTLSSQVLPFPSTNTSSFFPSQTSPFAPKYSNGISTQTSLSFLSSTYPPTTSSFTFPPINPIASQASPSPFAPQPKTDADSAFGPSFTFWPTNSTTCPPTTSSVNQFSYPPLVAPSPSISTSNANAGAQIPSLSNTCPAQAVQTTNIQSSAEVAGPSTSSQGQSSTVNQPVVNASPFGELPAISRLSISLPGSTISVEYGISSTPVHDKPLAPVRLSSSSTSSQMSHYHIRLPSWKYDSKSEGPKVPHFNQDETRPSVRANTLATKENPRHSVVISAELWPQTEEISSPEMRVSFHGNREGVTSENNTKPRNVFSIDLSVYEPDDAHHVQLSKEDDEIEKLMPQLSLLGYYTEPSITQLAEKEKAEPGYCGRVNDFEIGRCGYGSIKFLGETDVRNLSLDSLVEFSNGKVVVYKNENKKPCVGEGLNKQAEITLFNINCVDKKTGKRYVDGPMVEKYKEKLMKKGEEQGAEFISYDPAKGEWKFKVQHF